MEGDVSIIIIQTSRRISIHALRVEGDQVIRVSPAGRVDFYPRPPGGGRHKEVSDVDVDGYFYPRPPGGGRRPMRRMLRISCTFLSTPSGWRATYMSNAGEHCGSISIHALRVEGDRCLIKFLKIHNVFLSTPSGWRATFLQLPSRRRPQNFYPRPPGGGRRRRLRQTFPQCQISIHALRVEGDFNFVKVFIPIFAFLSTPSGWRATSKRGRGGDRPRNFYPRPPGGGRPESVSGRTCSTLFLSTPSGWRATFLRVGRALVSVQFLSTPSGWRATADRALHKR